MVMPAIVVPVVLVALQRRITLPPEIDVKCHLCGRHYPSVLGRCDDCGTRPHEPGASGDR